MRRARASEERRGGALVALGCVLAAWLVLRVGLWEAPFTPASLLRDAFSELVHAPVADKLVDPDVPRAVPESKYEGAPLRAWEAPRVVAPVPDRVERPVAPPLPQVERPFVGFTPVTSPVFAEAPALVAHAQMGRSGYKYVLPATEAPEQTKPEGAASPARWSMDMWALLRDGSASQIFAATPNYGRSQVGAVLRYDLAPRSGHAPQLYLRATSALEGAREREAALGIAARPLRDLPIRLAVEARLAETASSTETRAAAYAVSEFPAVTLPYGASGEAYVQAGYVTGDFASGFVDGQARIIRPVARTEDFRLEAGAGAWGGAQRGAERLDVGPTAAMTFRLGPASARVAADYRFRVAGAAAPASGPALTVSAGF
ncbi:MAG: hypothetical protein WBA68_05700 [Alteraurantiacibacter sp.]